MTSSLVGSEMCIRDREQHVLVVYKNKYAELSQQHAPKEATLMAKLQSQREEVKGPQMVEHNLTQVIQDTENRIALEPVGYVSDVATLQTRAFLRATREE
eukprot:9798429-Prorocentrum_lima.AAC.1